MNRREIIQFPVRVLAVVSRRLHRERFRLTKRRRRFVKVNLGSGRRDWYDWMLLDEIRYPTVNKFRSSPSCRIPLSDESVKIVYTSHHLEHLDNQSVYRVLAEASRVLEDGGHLLVKIPDFELFLSEFRMGRHELLDQCGVDSVVWSWPNYGIIDSPSTRTAMMFCGYWNHDYGDHFSNRWRVSASAYHGPPKLSADEIDSCLMDLPIRKISELFNQTAACDPSFKQFNHQNAWSREDFIATVQATELRLVELSTTKILSEFSTEIPDLAQMVDMSAYYLFKK